MARLHQREGRLIPYTAEDEAQAEADAARFARERPIEEARTILAATDASLPRALEDIYDALAPETQAKVATETRDRIAAKKALRAELLRLLDASAA